VWMRILWDRPLTRAREAALGREAASTPGPASVDAYRAESVPTSSNDGIGQMRAVTRLMRCLSRRDRTPVPSRRVLLERLDEWRAEFGDVGGWVHLVWCWTYHVVQETRGPRRRALHAPGLLRYLSAFAKKWVRLTYDLPIEEAEDRRDEMAERMTLLADELQQLNSAGVGRIAVISYLRFVRQ